LLAKAKRNCNGNGIYTFLRRDGVVCGWGDNQYNALGLDDVYYNSLQFLNLPPVLQYLADASPTALLKYANRGTDYFHQLCFDMALSKLSQIQAVGFIGAFVEAVPLFTADRCKASGELQALFPGFELLEGVDKEVQYAYARLLVRYRALSGSLRSDHEQQYQFVQMLKKIASPKDKIEDSLRATKQSREQAGQSHARQQAELTRESAGVGLSVFAEQLQGLSQAALQQAADILAHRLPVPDMSEDKRKAEDELEDEDRKDKVKKPKY
jgi:hypothetical protein